MTDERYFFFDKRYAALRDVPFLPAPRDTPRSDPNAPISLALDEDLTFPALDASLAQHLGNGGKFVRVKFASILRAYGDATHAGDARLAIHLPWIVLVDSSNRAQRSASTAGDAILRCMGHHTVASSLLIRTIARNRGLGRSPVQ